MVQKRNKGNDLKFQVIPPKKDKNQDSGGNLWLNDRAKEAIVIICFLIVKYAIVYNLYKKFYRNKPK